MDSQVQGLLEGHHAVFVGRSFNRSFLRVRNSARYCRMCETSLSVWPTYEPEIVTAWAKKPGSCMISLLCAMGDARNSRPFEEERNGRGLVKLAGLYPFEGAESGGGLASACNDNVHIEAPTNVLR